MTLVVHTKTKELVGKLFQKIQNNESIHHPFWLVNGVKHIGKATVMTESIKGLLGQYSSSDFLHIKDFSAELGKIHSLKIELKKNDQTDELSKDYMYDDYWVREIKEWLARSPLGNYKVVLIENIERMTVNAANALLKTIEEPGEWRLIVATTSSLTALLDTIRSRALLVKFLPPTLQEIESHLTSLYSEINKNDASMIAKLSQWRIGFAVKMAEMVTEDGSDLLQTWKDYKSNVNDGQLIQLNKFLIQVNKDGLLDDLLTMIQYDSIEHYDFALNDMIVQTKKYLASNVSTDWSLLNLSMYLTS